MSEPFDLEKHRAEQERARALGLGYAVLRHIILQAHSDADDGISMGRAVELVREMALRAVDKAVAEERAEIAWLRTPIRHDEVCANCGHAKFHHHDYRCSETANDLTKCWGEGFARDNCEARCEQFVRHTFDGKKP